MRRRAFVAVFGWLLLVFGPALAAPTSVVGSISSRGNVEINGVSAPSGMIVYADNHVVTSPGAVAIVMLARGGKVALGSSTSASLSVASGKLLVKLDSGAVDAVSETKDPVFVEAGGVTVRSRNRNGDFEVVLTGGALRVIARRGTAVAEGANRTVEIEAGKTMKTRLARTGEGSSGRMKTVLIVAGAAGAAGLAAAIHGSSGSSKKTCVSPSQLSCP